MLWRELNHQAVFDGSKYIIQTDSAETTAYTVRSLSRDLNYFQEKLSRTDKKKLLFIAPYYDALHALFKENSNFIFFAPVLFSNSVAHERLIVEDSDINFFVNSIQATDIFAVDIHPSLLAFREIIENKINQVFSAAAHRLKTIQHFYRRWPMNFRVNQTAWLSALDLSSLPSEPPDALVMAGPSLNDRVSELRSKQNVWCVDTALPLLAFHKVKIRVVFSIDAGFASLEHFHAALKFTSLKNFSLVADVLTYPDIWRIPFKQIYTYQSSYPEAQAFAVIHNKAFSTLINPTGDVGGLIVATYQKRFHRDPDRSIIYGHDGIHRRHITHARGTAYFNRMYQHSTRVHSIEGYFFKLSARYSG